MRNSLAGQFKHLEEYKWGGSFLAENWTDDTRELHPLADKIGYNTQRKRIEYYVKAEDKWYYMWGAEVDLIPPTPPPSLFQDNFEEGWVTNNIFTKIMEEDFDTGWQIDHIFIQLFSEDFQTNWHIYNIFTQLFSEDFESADWI
jgi:hypothetical protein